MPFDLPGFRPNFGRQARLASMSPLDAARSLLCFEFGIGDESAIGFALRRDPRITLDDDAIMDVFSDLIDEAEAHDEDVTDWITPGAFLDRLATRSASRR